MAGPGGGKKARQRQAIRDLKVTENLMWKRSVERKELSVAAKRKKEKNGKRKRKARGRNKEIKKDRKMIKTLREYLEKRKGNKKRERQKLKTEYLEEEKRKK